MSFADKNTKTGCTKRIKVNVCECVCVSPLHAFFKNDNAMGYMVHERICCHLLYTKNMQFCRHTNTICSVTYIIYLYHPILVGVVFMSVPFFFSNIFIERLIGQRLLCSWRWPASVDNLC